ncbi:MAG: arsenate reductase ArsC [Deltaproteobacteria bacterium]|nr:arsenate reductase ArsC [Deltaproteobacteria bacterium]
MPDKKRILFLCTGNSCRSQMAEGLARHLKGEVLEVYSAGTSPQKLNSDAVIVMREVGIDISSHKAKSIDDLGGLKFDYVITVCDDANESCPLWPGRGKVVHRGFDDPPRLAARAASETERLAPYRRVRDEIKAFVQTLPEGLEL